MLNDLHNVNTIRRAIEPQSGAANNNAIVSQIIDRAGYEALEFLIALGSIADVDATFTVLVEDGAAANLSDAAAVDDKFLLGTEAEASFQFDSDNGVRKIGYIGGKRYVRLTITPANNTGAWLVSVLAQLGGARHKPSQAGTGVETTQTP